MSMLPEKLEYILQGVGGGGRGVLLSYLGGGPCYDKQSWNYRQHLTLALNHYHSLPLHHSHSIRFFWHLPIGLWVEQEFGVCGIEIYKAERLGHGRV